MKTITVWQRYNKKKDGTYRWEHNHVSDGYDENQQTPTPINEYQKRMWADGTWRKQKAYLDNDIVKYSI